MRALDRLLDVGAEQLFQPLDRIGGHLARPLGSKLAAERTRDIDIGERRAADIGEQRRGALALGLLEHQIVAREPERIAGNFERHALVIAEAKPARGIDVPLRHAGAKASLPSASTLVETVTMTARACSAPLAVSTVMPPRGCVLMRVTGEASCTFRPSASFASSAPKPCRQ